MTLKTYIEFEKSIQIALLGKCCVESNNTLKLGNKPTEVLCGRSHWNEMDRNGWK